MGKDYEIILDQAEATFTPGSVVRGSLLLNTEEPKSYTKITVSLKGKGKVHWQEGSGENAVHYWSSEKYVNSETIVWTSDQSPSGTLDRGRYTFPFEFVLPESCPPSYKDHIAHITYEIKGRISTGPFKLDRKVSHPISVLKQVSIDKTLTQRDINVEKKKQVGFSCCGCGVISFSSQLPCDGFNVGEEIPVQVEVENGSGRQIKMRARLLEKFTYITSRKQIAREKTSVVQEQSQPLDSHALSSWTTSNFVVPQVGRPAITTANIVKSQFVVRVSAVIPWALNSSIDIPVNIGNVGQVQDETQFS